MKDEWNKMFMNEHQKLQEIKAPKELEDRLRQALEKTPPKEQRFNHRFWPFAAAALIFLCFFGYHYNAVAYYGKTLFGFDQLFTQSLKDLNEAGMGQMIGKETILSDGSVLTIDGVMADENQFLLYYTLENLNGIDPERKDVLPNLISGFLTKSNPVGGISKVNTEGTELKGTMSFDPVNPLAKKLTVSFRVGGIEGTDTLQISFPFNPNKALQTEIKQNVNQSFQSDHGTIKFESIRATPTMTLIEGKVHLDYRYEDDSNFIDTVELHANGQPIERLGSSLSSSIKGSKMELRFDALPENLESLELVIEKLPVYKEIAKKSIELSSISEEPILLEGNEVLVKKISETAVSTEITFSTEENVRLNGVSIISNGKHYPLDSTIDEKMIKTENGRILKERTIVFKKVTNPETLYINGIHYMKAYEERIRIPIE
ncbi:DUF4179 domain-containing protein [Cytobacillus gottheilii]|uniref:DUF4179 domain-containing protein n=1 Tax=Cytobacillus gottheilii TaxID=859144 RepID=UPI0024947EEC|nr:DUF4179 domain-containing protein [Cytobacillus gottheilii]